MAKLFFLWPVKTCMQENSTFFSKTERHKASIEYKGQKMVISNIPKPFKG